MLYDSTSCLFSCAYELNYIHLRLSFAIAAFARFPPARAGLGRLSNVPEIDERNLGLRRAGAPCTQLERVLTHSFAPVYSSVME